MPVGSRCGTKGLSRLEEELFCDVDAKYPREDIVGVDIRLVEEMLKNRAEGI